MKANAFVRGNSLDCYNWEAEEGLVILAKIQELDEEHHISLFQAYNLDRKEYGAVDSAQIILMDKTLQDAKPLTTDAVAVYSIGEDILAFTKEEVEDK